jgi:hypothetical protein
MIIFQPFHFWSIKSLSMNHTYHLVSLIGWFALKNDDDNDADDYDWRIDASKCKGPKRRMEKKTHHIQPKNILSTSFCHLETIVYGGPVLGHFGCMLSHCLGFGPMLCRAHVPLLRHLVSIYYNMTASRSSLGGLGVSLIISQDCLCSSRFAHV